jgi:hypothetical protein
VEIYKCSTEKIPEFYLIDTPGFDDSTRSDTDILREVASWLTMAYSKDIKLTGIIYLHRILDVRLGGAAMKNLRMFKKLCGEESLGGVVLATTFWSNVDEETGLMREEQLKTKQDFWGGLIERGSTVFRQDKGRVSGEHIINHLVERRRKVVLEIQHEMVDRNKTLDQTAAGGEVQAELLKAKAEYQKQLEEVRQEMQDAIDAHDKAWQEEMRQSREELEAKIRKDEEDRARLQADQERLWREREAEREEERRQWIESKLEAEQQIARYERDLEMARINNAHTLEMQEIKNRLRLEEERVRMYKEKEENSCIVM